MFKFNVRIIQTRISIQPPVLSHLGLSSSPPQEDDEPVNPSTAVPPSNPSGISIQSPGGSNGDPGSQHHSIPCTEQDEIMHDPTAELSGDDPGLSQISSPAPDPLIGKEWKASSSHLGLSSSPLQEDGPMSPSTTIPPSNPSGVSIQSPGGRNGDPGSQHHSVPCTEQDEVMHDPTADLPGDDTGLSQVSSSPSPDPLIGKKRKAGGDISPEKRPRIRYKSTDDIFEAFQENRDVLDKILSYLESMQSEHPVLMPN